MPPPPDPLFFLRGSHQGARLYPSGAGEGQDTAPRAARCRSVLVEQACTPTRAVAPSFHPSRGGSVVAPLPWLVLGAGKQLQYSAPLGLQQPFGPLTSAPIPALEFSGYCRPPGGTSNRGPTPPVRGRCRAKRDRGGRDPQRGPNGSPAQRVPLGEDERRNE